MGKLKKLKGTELVGSAYNGDVYPITSIDGVYDGNTTLRTKLSSLEGSISSVESSMNELQDNIEEVESDVRDIEDRIVDYITIANYSAGSSDPEAGYPAYTLSDLVREVPYNDRRHGYILTFANNDGTWQICQFQGGNLNEDTWNNINNWKTLYPINTSELTAKISIIEWGGAIVEQEISITPLGLNDPSGGEVCLVIRDNVPKGFILVKDGQAYNVWLGNDSIPPSSYYESLLYSNGTITWPDNLICIGTGNPYSTPNSWVSKGTSGGLMPPMIAIIKREKSLYISSNGNLMPAYREFDSLPNYVEWSGITTTNTDIEPEALSSGTGEYVVVLQYDNNNPVRFLLYEGETGKFYDAWMNMTYSSGSTRWAIPDSSEYWDSYNNSFRLNTLYRSTGNGQELLGLWPSNLDILPPSTWYSRDGKTLISCGNDLITITDKDNLDIIAYYGIVSDMIQFRADGDSAMEMVYNRVRPDENGAMELISDEYITLPGATTTSPGIMSVADKKAIEEVKSGVLTDFHQINCYEDYVEFGIEDTFMENDGSISSETQWQELSAATTSMAGVMPAADKRKVATLFEYGPSTNEWSSISSYFNTSEITGATFRAWRVLNLGVFDLWAIEITEKEHQSYSLYAPNFSGEKGNLITSGATLYVGEDGEEYYKCVLVAPLPNLGRFDATKPYYITY